MATPQWLLDKVAELNKRYQESNDYQENEEVVVAKKKKKTSECIRCLEPFQPSKEQVDIEICNYCNKEIFTD